MKNISIFQDMEGMPPNLLMDLYFNAPAEVDLEFKKKRGGGGTFSENMRGVHLPQPL